RSLAEWQWPDGGWNCDKKASGYRSSFHESLPPMWGLHEYWAATGEEWARQARDAAAELFLEHRLFRSLRTRQVVNAAWLAPAPARQATRGPTRRWSTSSADDERTGCGEPAGSGGARRARTPATSRSSTGATRRTRCSR